MYVYKLCEETVAEAWPERLGLLLLPVPIQQALAIQYNGLQMEGPRHEPFDAIML